MPDEQVSPVEPLKEMSRPFHMVGILDGAESFQSGHFTLEEASARTEQANADATKLGIKTRYKVIQQLVK